MTVTANTTRNDYVGNGQSVYSYTFQLNDASDVTVYLDGVVQTLNTHYTVENVGVGSGGTITFTLVDANNDPIHPTLSNVISIVMEMDLDRDTNYQQSGLFAASDVNNDFDRLWLATNQQQTRLGRSIHIANNDLDRNMFLPLYNQRADKVLAFDSNGNLIVGPLVSDTNTIAGISSDISTVAGISANVTTVSGIAPNVTTVAGISSDVTTVAGLSASDLGTVATNINSVNTVATNASDVVSVAGKITEVETVADDLDLGANSLVKEVADDLALGNSSLIKEVADNMTDVTNASNLVTATVATGSEGTNVTYDANTGVLTVPRGATGNTGPTGLTGATGDGFTGGSYDPSTGRITFNSDDGLGFYTGDVRGAASTVAGPTGPTGPQGAQGIQGNQGDQGDGFTGASYNANDGTVTFTSIDGLGFQTGDLRGVKGDTGSDGPEGPDGPQGPQGPIGPQGEQGAAGPAGASATAAGSLVYNGSTKLQAYSSGIDVTGDIVLGDNNPSITLNDSSIANLQHIIKSTSNKLQISTDPNGVHNSSRIEFLVDNTERMQVTHTGIDVIGTATMDGLTVDGEGTFAKNQTADTAVEVSNLGTAGATTTSSFIVSETAGTPKGWFRRYRDGSARTAVGFSDHLVFEGAVGSTPTERMRINSSGNVGIGTSSPAAKLHTVGANANATNLSTSATNAKVRSQNHSGSSLSSHQGYTGNSWYNQIANGNGTTAYDLSLNPYGGNVGIGTNSPSTKLHVAGGNSGTNQALFRASSEGGGGLQIVCSDLSVANPLWSLNTFYGEALAFGDGTNEHMRINSSGKVGIGTTSPATTLEVKSNATNDFITLQHTSGPKSYIGNSSVGSLVLSADEGNSGNTSRIEMKVDGSERMRIDASGNLLVGKTSADNTTQGIRMLGSAGFASFVRAGAEPIVVNRLTNDGDLIDFRKDGTTVGTIGTRFSDMYIGTGDTTLRFNDADDRVNPADATGNARDAVVDLGNTTSRFKDLYLSGTAYSGNLLVGQTSTGDYTTTAGSSFRASGFSTHTRDGGDVLLLNRLTSDGSILQFRKDNSTVGSIGSIAGGIEVTAPTYLVLGCDDTGIRIASNEYVLPYNPSTDALKDGTVSLGVASSRFKDLYLSGTVTADNVKLDDANIKPSYNYAIKLFQGYQSLLATPTQIGPDFYLRNYNDKHYKRFVEYSARINYTGTFSTNDINVRATLVVPASSGSAVDIGSVESIASSGMFEVNMVIAGDVSHWFSEYSGVSPNSNGTGPFSLIMSVVYNPSTDKTTINAGTYGMTAPSVGDSIYVHPFDWEAAGSEIYYQFEHDVDSEANMIYEIYNKVYVGNIDRTATFRFKLLETASSDVGIVSQLKAFQLDERA